jgi:hypothetical protein
LATKKVFEKKISFGGLREREREREREKFHLMFGGLQKNSNLLFGFHLQEDDDDIQIQIRACFVGSVLQGRDIMMHPEADAPRSGPRFGIPACIHSF